MDSQLFLLGLLLVSSIIIIIGSLHAIGVVTVKLFTYIVNWLKETNLSSFKYEIGFSLLYLCSIIALIYMSLYSFIPLFTFVQIGSIVSVIYRKFLI